METRLKILMEKENLTVGKLADMLGVKPAGISHILKGRNNPNFELTAKIVSTFKRYNPYWLLGYSDQIFNEGATTSADATLAAPTNVAHIAEQQELTPKSEPMVATSLFDLPTATSSQRSDIDHIIIVYRDKTFESLTPKR